MSITTRSRVIVALLAAAALGCGRGGRDATGRVTGAVSLDGKPVENAVIIFTPESGRPAYGAIRNGEILDVETYKPGDGVVVGKALVSIQPAAKEGPMKMLNPTDGPGGPSRSGGSYMDQPAPKKRNNRAPPRGGIPKRYRNPATSGISVDIEAGGSELRIELASE